ncbi:MAG TPA: hypothetical protein VFA07_00150 [Chthonomonadaceae bacterium]|nr:hypothetical protein [Chthonomonadaceae bacterium]
MGTVRAGGLRAFVAAVSTARRPEESRETPVVTVPRAPAIPHIVWMIAMLALLLRIGLALATHYTSEDYMITLRYAENLAHGQGFVYNAGERVLGTTTPLYTLFLALVARLGLNATAAGKTLNILADSMLCVVMYRWLSSVGEEAAGKLAAFWAAVDPLHLRWAISGMETGLVTLCGAWIWLAYAQRRYVTAYAVLAVLFLLRWDTTLLALVLTAAICWRERRLPLKELSLYVILIAPWLLFATWYFGSPIPVTGAAKMTVYGWRGRSALLPYAGPLFMAYFGAALPFTLLAFLGIRRVIRQRWTVLLPPLIWFGLYWVAFLVSKILLFSWYLVPPSPVYGMLAALGALQIARQWGRAWPRSVWLGSVGAVAGLVTVTIAWAMFLSCRESQRIEDNLGIPIGLWLQRHSRPSDRILLEPIGYIGYTSQRPILDAVGLVTPAVLPYYNSRNAAPLLNISLAFRPEWCVLRPGEIQHILDAQQSTGIRWTDLYEPVKTFRYTPRPDRDWIIFTIYHRK